jgi:hypothetical protein
MSDWNLPEVVTALLTLVFGAFLIVFALKRKYGL